MQLHQFLEHSARRTPDAVAIVEPRRTSTYAALDALANRFSRLLQSAGVRRGDRVVLALDNGIEVVAAYLGTMKAGAVAVPLPAGPRSDRLRHAIGDCAPAAAVVDAATAAQLEPDHALLSVPAVFVALGQGADATRLTPPLTALEPALEASSDDPAGVRAIDLDLAAIIYTSGSTGRPRGVMLTHRNIVTNTYSIVSYLGLTAADRVMCVLPFYYVYGLSLLHTHLAVGASVVVDNRFAFPNVVLGTMQQQSVTGFAGVPSTFALLLHRSSLATTPLPSLRYVTQAGGPMPVAQIQEWLQRGPNVPFYVMYGATEASARLTYLNPANLARKLGSIGRAIPNVEIVVRRDDGTPAAQGEIGELVARGANISSGYWNDPVDTALKFGGDGYRTGDLGYFDADGYLFVVGRRDEMLKLAGHRVGPKEIEDVICEFPGVHEAAVVGAPHDLLGEVAVAFLAVRDPSAVAADAVQAFCRMRLPPFKVPTQFIVGSELPKLGAVGKIDRTRLREQARHVTQGAAR